MVLKPNIDVILCDYTLPSYSGTEALVEARRAQPDTPFIFVSGTIGEDRAVESLRSGATDYVLKDRLARLSQVVRRALHEAKMRRAQQQAEDAMRASEHKYRQMFESLGDAALLIRETTGKIIDANPQAEVLLGCTRGEILGRSELGLSHLVVQSDLSHLVVLLVQFLLKVQSVPNLLVVQ